MEKKILKENGRYYTPQFIVENMLDFASYYDDNIISKHVIDNSCGDGAFIVEIINRYCKAFLKKYNNIEILKQHLETYIHAIEIDRIELNKCIEKANYIVSLYGIFSVNWDFLCADTLDTDRYNGKMDYVIGNPPYVRVHNLGNKFDKIKKFSFVQNGMTDLYIVFYEIGIKMLNKNGLLAYITPSSIYNSVAAKFLREHIITTNKLIKVIDLKHFQAFDATTYSTILILKNKNISEKVEYYCFDEKNKIPYYVDTLATSK